jgi:hypothetical protein
LESEKYKKWIPIKDIPDTLVLFGLHDNYEGFRILLRDEKTHGVMRIFFDSFVSYRNTSEVYLLKTLHERKGVVKWPLFIVENSGFLKSLHEEEDVDKQLFTEKPIHYAIITPNNCIDVISSSLPKVEWLCDYSDEI